MAIIRKERLRTCLAELDAYHQKLRDTVTGTPPSPNLCSKYNCETDQFQREYTDIDEVALHSAILHFQAAVSGLKRIKSLKD
jgi:hypothetical protein